MQNTDRLENLVFALDIGTRSIVGIVGEISQDTFTVWDFEQRFHQKRAMRDGQIEDIHLVARMVREVKNALETRNSLELKKVSIAAAGRSLRTTRTTFEQELNEEDDISSELLHSIEYNTISLALDRFSEDLRNRNPEIASSSESSKNNFSCVGYNVVHYHLDGYPLENPIGHRGKLLKIELIAAFLPFSVVRSLYSVTELCGLTVESLTLEPIAAINAVVPPDIRLLNIAIADIGAGTSDIGISKSGSIVAYDMVTIAGDEITEAIMKEYLVDFNTAEMIKHRLSDGLPEISFADILGFNHTCTTDAVLDIIDPIIELLSKSIAESILKVNDGPPTALFLVGGGSQIPRLTGKTATNLGLPEQRVTLGGKQPYRNISLHSEALLTPEYVTPLGIGATSRLTHIHDLFSVTVNGEKITLPGTETIKVMDALLLAGVKASNLIGRSVPPLVYYVNGEKKSTRGEPPVAGEIYVNKQPASLDTTIRQGDSISTVFAQHGKKPSVSLGDILEPFGEQSYGLVNNHRELSDYQIQSEDRIEVFRKEPVPAPTPVQQTAAQQQTPMPAQQAAAQQQAPTPVQQAATQQQTPTPVQQAAAQQQNVLRTVRVGINSRWVEIPVLEGRSLIFVDMLNYANIDTKNPQGELILLINGRPASYTDPVFDNDEIEIRWSE